MSGAVERVAEFVRRWRDDCVADYDALQLADLEALLLAQPTADEAEGDDVAVDYIETPYDRVIRQDDGTRTVEGLPFRAQRNGVQVAASSPEIARTMLARVLEADAANSAALATPPAPERNGEGGDSDA